MAGRDFVDSDLLALRQRLPEQPFAGAQLRGNRCIVRHAIGADA